MAAPGAVPSRRPGPLLTCCFGDAWCRGLITAFLTLWGMDSNAMAIFRGGCASEWGRAALLLELEALDLNL